MMKEKLNYKSSFLALVLILMIFSCSKEMDDKYKDPPWLKGDNIKTLEDAKDYTIFLELLKKAGYENSVKKQLSTLFAPNDNAFKEYFQKQGITSINDLSEEEAQELFTCHYLPDPINANHLVYEKAWKRLESPTGEYATFYFRKKTKTYSIYTETPKYDKTFKGQELYIWTKPKFLPVFSKLFFDDNNANGDIDYPFMYPESNWGGLLQWHNAQVTVPTEKKGSTNIEDGVITTSSGFIYKIDKVIGPTLNIEQYLAKHQDKYGLFYDLLQRFATYTVEKTDSRGRVLYTKSYSDISNIANESGPIAKQYMEQLYVFTLFAPSDSLLQSFLNNTVLKSYESLDSVPDITIRYILQSQITNNLELKSKFTKAFYNVFGDKSVLDANNVEPGFMCSNGVIYKSKKMLVPNTFVSVAGPLFFSKHHSKFITLLSNTSMIPTISSIDRRITLFAPSNENFESANIRMYLTAANKYEFQEKTDDGLWVTYNASELNSFVQDHIYNGDISDLSGDGYIEMMSHNFVHYSSNSLTGGLNVNMGSKATIGNNEVKNNGTVFYIDNPIRTRYRMGQYITNDPDLSLFASLMVKTGLLTLGFQETETKNTYDHITVTDDPGQFYWTAFIPNNAAVSAAVAAGLDTSGSEATKANLKSFVNYHLLSKKTIFDDGKVAGTFGTYLAGSSITITNSPNNLQITDATGHTVTVIHSNADHLVRRGVVHKITSVLNYK